MIEIYILRHGESIANKKKLVCGAKDFELTRLGRKQAKRACENLKSNTFSKIYSSPLKRAIDSIEYIGSNQQIIIEDNLKELDTGDYSFLSIEELWEKDIRYKYQGMYPTLKYPNGESLADMITRIKIWWDKEFNLWESNEKVLVAGHEGTACALIHILTNMSIVNYPTFKIQNCETLKIEINKDNQIRFSYIKN